MMNHFMQPFVRSVILSDNGLEKPHEEKEAPAMPYVPAKLEKSYTYRHAKNPEDPDLPGIDKVSGMTPLKGLDFPIYLNQLVNRNSDCDVLICVAMYNEGIHEFNATLKGVAKNLRYFVKYGIPLKKITCIVIVDGTSAFLKEIRKNESDGRKSTFRSIFDEDMIKEAFEVDTIETCKFDGQQELDEFAHIFVHNIEFEGVDEGYPLQLVFCIKQQNKRKLNTHLWFFGGFCEMIQPKYVVLLDVGTEPEKKALFYMIEAMETDENLAGSCGELVPEIKNVWNPIVMAQVVEYKFAHIFDKALESVMGYITVLPGAFSAYRWDTLKGKPLWQDYFKSLCHPEEMDCFHSNIYLAEDRVLCMALVSKPKHQYTLRYVRKSVARTDVPESLGSFLIQRRRWINGSWFSLIKALNSVKRINKSKHSCGRKCLLYSEMFYYYINVAIAWVMVGLFFAIFAIAVRKGFDYEGDIEYVMVGNYLLMFYLLALVTILILSLAVKSKKVEGFYRAISVIMGIFMYFILYLMIALMFDESVDTLTLYIALGIVGAFLLTIFVNHAVVSVLKGILQFLYLVPTFINIFLIYSICNIHDCTWGSRPDTLTLEENNKIEEFQHFRAKWVLFWVVCNGAIGYGLSSLDKDSDEGLIVLSIITIIEGSCCALGPSLGLFM